MYYKRFGLREGILSFLGPGLFYTGIAFVIGYIFWPYFYYIKNEHIIAVGIFTIYRYLWLLLNYIRSLIYHHVQYPKLREQALKIWRGRPELRPKRIYFVIPSYREEPWITIEMLQSVMSELSHIPCNATLIVATASDEEDKLFASIFESHPVSHKVELVLQRQEEGKRIAMGDALRAVARRYHSQEEDYNSITILMDGDSALEPGTLEKVLAFFTAFPHLGAVTTNEIAYIRSRSRWYKDWFNMKFGQRHILFGSHSLSKRVLTLTGRFSAFRTVAVIEKKFIERLERDYLKNPIFGTFRFLMGDDKSTWFQMLKDGWDMLYIPDCICYSLESREGNFIKVSLQLLFRWYGNTLRNSNRALSLGPKGVGGWFIWFAILDQKLSMWTALVGITSAIMLSLGVHPVYLPVYLAWVLVVRSVQSAAIAIGGHPVSYRTVPLMLYNQWMGALVKIWVNYHLPHQKWEKGGKEQDASSWWVKPKHPLAPIIPKFSMLVSTVLFLFILALSEGLLSVPDLRAAMPEDTMGVIEVRNIAKINEILKKAPNGSLIRLPKGTFEIYKPIVIARENIVLDGNGAHIVAHTPMEALILIKGKRKKLKGLKEDAKRGNTYVHLKEVLHEGDVLLIRRPNDSDFLKAIGSERWNKRYPYIRQEIFEVKGKVGDKVLLDRELFFDFPKEQTEVFVIEKAKRITVRNLTLEYRPKGDEHPPPHIYENLLPGDKTDLIAVKDAAFIKLENVKLKDAAKHPLNLDSVYEVVGNHIDIDGAWNKGKSGNGYLRLARAFMCQLENIKVKNIRHITIQWSSAYNLLQHVYSQVDLNFHGGYPHHNRVVDITFNIPEEHPWKGVVYIPNNASFAPPNGPGNEVLGITSVNR